MSIVEILLDNNKWRDFYAEKFPKLSKVEAGELFSFIDECGYEQICRAIGREDYPFGLPERRLINKMGTGKKRVIYAFKRDESLVLKFIARYLGKYDDIFSPRLFSFRRAFGVKGAVCSVLNENTAGLFCYKADISDYFNSIDVDILLDDLDRIMTDETELLALFRTLLTVDAARSGEEIIHLKRGAMAGTPVSPFFANVFLMPLDSHFAAANAHYARYSDDIIVFAKTRAELDGHIGFIREFLASRGLKLNPEKECVLEPFSRREFLGIAYADGEYDLSRATLDKIKGKISRKSRALYRWMQRTDSTPERAAKALLRRFNHKFYFSGASGELTWSRWFFPVLTTADGLHTIDDYLAQNVRFLFSGKHRKKNLSVRHADLKSLGFRPLVNEYYKFLKARAHPQSTE